MPEQKRPEGLSKEQVLGMEKMPFACDVPKLIAALAESERRVEQAERERVTLSCRLTDLERTHQAERRALLALREKVERVPHLWEDSGQVHRGSPCTSNEDKQECARLGGACLFTDSEDGAPGDPPATSADGTLADVPPQEISPSKCSVCGGALCMEDHEGDVVEFRYAHHSDDNSPANAHCKRACHRCGGAILRWTDGVYYHTPTRFGSDVPMVPAHIPGVQDGCERRHGKVRRSTLRDDRGRRTGDRDRRNPNPPEQGGDFCPPDDRPAQWLPEDGDPHKPHQRPVHPRVGGERPAVSAEEVCGLFEGKLHSDAVALTEAELGQWLGLKHGQYRAYGACLHCAATTIVAQYAHITYLEQAAKDQVAGTEQQIRDLETTIRKLATEVGNIDVALVKMREIVTEAKEGR